ncbi:hypothetical protein Aple_040230 [Acrocarpospora pleiomorpha]|uniref:Protein kinase domain-containing protein n=2 Tax=Acrocarpospora pleiomorpha TaxID=90975 RepID=A0A5M3XHZ2_9ACTN|nr:hypothetical protein Aple_040230 [Acrocarpospora pleiomorpha]
MPSVNFLAHAMRQNEAGGRIEFEQMLGMLVQAIEGIQARIPEPSGSEGDWGIDVLIGELHGRVSIWQAKYYIDGFNSKHHEKVRRSFKSALDARAKHHHVIDRWILCIPCTMPPASDRWWGEWVEQQEDTGIKIGLWDENKLRDLLARPEADHIRNLYYNPYRSPVDDHPAPITLAVPADDGQWRPGWINGHHLLHEDAVETPAADRSWVWRQATADRISPPGQRVVLRQVQLFRDSPHGRARQDGLVDQAALLDDLAGVRGLPRKAELIRVGDSVVTLATTYSAGSSWREALGPATALDRLGAAAVTAAAAAVCDSLHELHRRGHAHRALSPDVLILREGRLAAVLRDLGLAAIPVTPGEGIAPYQAPEQLRPGLAPVPPGPSTDIYQVAALVHHSISGMPGAVLPLRAVVPEFPDVLEDMLARALDADPTRRPADIRVLAAELRRAREVLSRGAMS